MIIEKKLYLFLQRDDVLDYISKKYDVLEPKNIIFEVQYDPVCLAENPTDKDYKTWFENLGHTGISKEEWLKLLENKNGTKSKRRG